VALLLPISDATRQLLRVYDNLICFVFLFDFGFNLARSHPKREYVVGRRGWLDLLGSIPSFGFAPWAGLFRLARLSRLARITRLLRGKKKRELLDDVLQHRGQYAAFITVLLGIIVLVLASVLVLQAESKAPDANITSGGGALWWAIVTITTVGYGDEYPVTAMGRIVAAFVMFAGIGIIGSLASILASVLVTSDDDEDGAAVPSAGSAAAPDANALQAELSGIRAELAALRASLATAQGGSPAPPG
jgi:voltage-gated potassium channel